MIRRNQKQLNRLNILTDALLVFLSYVFASWLWLGVVTKNPNMASLANLRSGTAMVAVLYAIWTVIVLGMLRVYRVTRIKKLSTELRNIALGNLIAVVTAAALLYLFRLQEFSRGVLGIYYITVVIAMVGKRLVVRYTLRYFRSKGYNLKHNLVVGGGHLAKRYAEAVEKDKSLGVHLAGIIPPRGKDWVEWLEAQLHGEGIDEVILALEPEELGVTVQVIQLCEKSGTKVSVIPFYNDVIPTRANIDNIGSIKLIQLRTTPLDEPFNAGLKRTFDIVVSALALVARETELAEALERHVHVERRIRTQNESVYYNVDAIQEAIASHRKVGFRYFKHDLQQKKVYGKGGALYHETPVHLVYSDGYYYLIAFNDQHDDFVRYRIDRMSHIQVLDDPATRNDRIANFDVEAFALQAFGMFGGEKLRVTIEFEASAIDLILDRFGTDGVIIIPQPDGKTGHATITVSKSSVFFGWLAGFGTRARIIAPSSLAQEFREYLSDIVRLYEK